MAACAGGHGGLLREAVGQVWLRSVAGHVDGSFGVAAVDSNRAVRDSVLYSGFNRSGVARLEGRALSSIDAAGAERGGMSAAVRLAIWQTGGS